MRYSLLLILLVLLTSCSKKELSSEQYQKIASGTTINLMDVIFLDNQHGFVVGGTPFSQSIILETRDGGSTWHSMTIENDADRIINKLYNYQDQKVYAVGIDGKVYVNYLDGSNWLIGQNIWWEWIRDIHFFCPDTAITVSGKSWSYGSIQRVDSFGQVKVRDTFNYELNDLFSTQPNHYLVAGYGVILHSEDNGFTWQESDASGDHFIKIEQAGSTLWAIGHYGTLLKSTDQGLHWKKLRNGSNPLHKRYLYNNIRFIDEQRGIIIGDKGFIMITSNSGENWNKLNTFTTEDLKGITYIQDKIILVGSNGSIFMLKSDFF